MLRLLWVALVSRIPEPQGRPNLTEHPTPLCVCASLAKQAHHVRRAFVEAGLPASITNLDVVPAEMARFRYVSLDRTFGT